MEGMRAQPGATLTEICKACGMCCDGTLYLYVTLTDDEVSQLAKYEALVLSTKHEQPTFAEPCVLHEAAGCSAYEDRPDACRRYLCTLLCDVERDELTVDEALLIVEEARARVDIVKELVPLEPGMPLAISIWDEPPDSVQGDARVAWERALWHLSKHFLETGASTEARVRRGPCAA